MAAEQYLMPNRSNWLLRHQSRFLDYYLRLFVPPIGTTMNQSKNNQKFLMFQGSKVPRH
jgi:hypothetical protein